MVVDTIGRRRLRACLREVPLFFGADHDELDAIARFSELSSLSAGERLYRRHEPGEAVFHVVRGLMKMTRRIGGGDRVLDVASGGRSVGLAALFIGTSHPLDAIAISETELLVMQAEPLRAYVESRPVLLLRLCAELAERHERMLMRLEQQVGRSAPERVALCLLQDAGDGNGSGDLRARRLFGDMRHADIANMLGITPETFSRVLARFRREGWIGDEDGVLHVHDREGLATVLGEMPVLRPPRDGAGARTALAR